MYSLKNAYLTVTVAGRGAELQSILGADGTEYLWQGNPVYWADRALNIFPYVARLTGGTYSMDGRQYAMSIHGFAAGSEFAPCLDTGTELVLELSDSPETYGQYPRHFRFRIRYVLEDRTLRITYRVENRDERTMYFGLGGHPGFCVPLENGLRFEDYRLRFDRPCRPQRVEFTPDCFRTGGCTAYPLQDGQVLPLRHELFDDDAIVLQEMAHQVTLEAENGGRSVTVSYPDMPYLGIWHRPRTDAPYVCLEPWCSLPSKAGIHTVFEEQEDLLRLEPGKTYENTWEITIR